MPEGDRVHLLAARLRPSLVDRVVVDGALRSGGRAGESLSGRRIVEVDTHGKHLLTRFDDASPPHTHLRMPGSWTLTRPGRVLPTRLRRQARVGARLDDGHTLWGVDLPVVDLVPTRDEHALTGHLGPDPLRPDWDPAEARRRPAALSGVTVRAALLDQRPRAGLGNLWVNEVGYLRGVHPPTPIGEVDLVRLVDVAARALRFSVTTPGAYQGTTGRTRRGGTHWVVGRAGRPCLRCGTRVEARDDPPTPDGRTRRAWWCPRCQPAA
ncbi:DNA-formamidopyrimidine glycosylase family protein [Frigoribacterium sp. RIT-PI-h]|uniref:DNA-formamidopyrimidine glycosylase family protein n=1 Tax=Frigoribacterium sp. RIT-PI-h TaxID=1690245 RepID=UPI0006B9E036|nr:DNA-formamidopyrimidine glycosylase family protein [Frigoribacterium sp. RIT-PI-h]KPG87556.1 cytosine methyltransferase [Frigoribacterium sp. RIT-PI-h]